MKTDPSTPQRDEHTDYSKSSERSEKIGNCPEVHNEIFLNWRRAKLLSSSERLDHSSEFREAVVQCHLCLFAGWDELRL